MRFFEMNNIFVYIEMEGGKVADVSLELLTKGRELATTLGVKLEAVVLGHNLAGIEKELAKYGADTVWVADDPLFSPFRTLPHTAVLCGLIGQEKPQIALFGATPVGRDFAPRVSSALHSGLTADCTQLEIGDHKDAKTGTEYKNLLYQIRPAFGGNIMAQIAIRRSRPQFATVRYCVMDRAERVQNPTGSVVKCTVTDDMARSRIRILSSEVIEKQKTIDEEDILVVAGRGVRSEKDVAMCRRLAEALGGQLAFTRPMVENGYGDQMHQIGLSGRTVRPRLIITCGVSGAIQFTSCMKDAECIVAINSDPEAQIFKTAHYCIVDDLYQVVPRLTALVQNRKED